MYRLNDIPQVIEYPHERLEIPATAAKGLPYLAVIFEGPKRYQSVVGGASAEDFGSRMPDVGVACELST